MIGFEKIGQAGRWSWMVWIALLVAGTSSAQERVAETNALAGRRTQAWTAETIELFATLPIQAGGRVKPLDSFAGLQLLTLNGKRSLKLDDGEKLSHTAWLLDCLLFPEQAKTYPCFRIQHDGVLTAAGLTPKAKRAWYSYNELVSARQMIFGLAAMNANIAAMDRTPVQRQVLKLAGDLRLFEDLVGGFDSLRGRYSVGDSAELAELFGSQGRITLAELLRHGAELQELSSRKKPEDEGYAAIRALSDELNAAMARGNGGLTLFPPLAEVSEGGAWWSVSDLARWAFDPHLDLSTHLDLLASLERLDELKTDPEAFRVELAGLNAGLVALAEARGEYGHIPLEVKLNRWDLFTNALVLFLLGFLLTAVGWLVPKNRWVRRGVWTSTVLATVLVVAGITMRCIIRERPPVVSLYDTILFITACAVLVSLFLERITRQRIALPLATIMGVFGMFLAGRYELKEVQSAGDTMASVIAVLDTNYYLAIHVTTIAMGYAGGLLAAAIAHVWIFGRLFGWKKDDPEFYVTITKMTYGVLCFSLLFSIFGTIMGGVWANDSWGRFWGWDPKENGALLICLWQLLIIHARLGGFIRDRGLAVFAVFGGVVVSASWWGVNLLNVGLHSYGFTSGIARTLFLLWAIEVGVMLLAGLDVLLGRSRDESASATSTGE